jgi:teichuronic acid biosynthesis glycosyltransferase TuaG
MTTPRVSIVIPTYNQAEFLEAALCSVIAQTVTDWEAIVVNNFSSDDTAVITDGFGDERIRRINFRNHGVIAASRNRGVALAQAPWIAFLDSDDLWTPDKLERCLAVADDKTDLISHPETIVRGGVTLGTTQTATAQAVTYHALLYRGNCLSPTAVMVHRSRLDAVGGFSEDPAIATAEDYDLWLRLARFGVRCKVVAAPLSQYTLHAASATASIERHLKANLAVLERHFAELGEPMPVEWALRRRARARVLYGAARSFHKAGRRQEALTLLCRSLGLYPLAPKAYAALAMALVP